MWWVVVLLCLVIEGMLKGCVGMYDVLSTLTYAVQVGKSILCWCRFLDALVGRLSERELGSVLVE